MPLTSEGIALIRRARIANVKAFHTSGSDNSGKPGRFCWTRYERMDWYAMADDLLEELEDSGEAMFLDVGYSERIAIV